MAHLKTGEPRIQVKLGHGDVLSREPAGSHLFTMVLAKELYYVLAYCSVLYYDYDAIFNEVKGYGGILLYHTRLG